MRSAGSLSIREAVALLLLVAFVVGCGERVPRGGDDSGAPVVRRGSWQQLCRYPLAGPVYHHRAGIVGGQTVYTAYDPQDPSTRRGVELPVPPKDCPDWFVRYEERNHWIGRNLAFSGSAEMGSDLLTSGWVAEPGHAIPEPGAWVSVYCRIQGDKIGDPFEHGMFWMPEGKLVGMQYASQIAPMSSAPYTARWALLLGADVPGGTQRCAIWSARHTIPQADRSCHEGAEQLDCSFGEPRAQAAVVSLSDEGGAALISGGLVDGKATGDLWLVSFDPTTRMVRKEKLTYRLQAPRYAHSATSLGEGKVLIAGGAYLEKDASGQPQERLRTSLEIVDTVAKTVTSISSGFGAVQHAVTVINGRVLLTGGTNSTRPELPTATHTPSGQVWLFEAPNHLERLVDLPEPRYGHQAIRTRKGTLVVIGGYGPSKTLAPHLWELELPPKQGF